MGIVLGLGRTQVDVCDVLRLEHRHICPDTLGGSWRRPGVVRCHSVHYLVHYGGGLATAPAYLADIFGTQFVGAIHGRLLTARATAGVIGPILVNQMRERQIKAGVPSDLAYDRTLYMLAGLFAAGFLANLLTRPVASKWHITHTQAAQVAPREAHGIGRGGLTVSAALAWSGVGLPLLWGVYVTLSKAVTLLT